MEAKRAIGFELLLAEKLVPCGFMRERWVPPLVIEDIIVFVPCQRRLDVEYKAPLGAVVINDAESRVWSGGWNSRRDGSLSQLGLKFLRAVPDQLPRKLNPDAKIDAREPFGVHKRRKSEVGVLLRIHDDDELTAALQQLVETEIIDMTAIGQVDLVALFRKPPMASARR